TDFINFINVYFRKYNLLCNPKAIISPSIKTCSLNSLKIPYPWQGSSDQSIQELVHSLSTKGNFCPNGHALTQFKCRNVLFGNGRNCLLSGNHGQLICRMVYQFLVRNSGADPSTQDDFF